MTPKQLLFKCYKWGMLTFAIGGFIAATKWTWNPLGILGFLAGWKYDQAANLFYGSLLAGFIFSGMVFIVALLIKNKAVRKIRNFFNKEL